MTNSYAIGGDGILNLDTAINTKIYDSSFENTTTIRGTITLSSKDVLYIENTRFTSATTKYGGHFRIKSASNVTLIDTNFTSGTSLLGGLMFSDFNNVIMIHNIIFKGGSAYGGGSLVYF